MRRIRTLFLAFLLPVLTFAYPADGQVPSGFLSSDQITGHYINADDRTAVVLIHGWTDKTLENPPVSQDSYANDEWLQLNNAVYTRLNGSDARLLLYHWEDDASTGTVSDDLIDFGFYNAASAAANAFSNGERLATVLNQAAPNLRRVAFVAHSAGAWAAYRAADKLLQANPYLVVNVVLLDPFVPGVDPTLPTPLTDTTMESLALREYQDRIYRIENYFAVDWTDTLGMQSTSQRFTWRNRDINQQIDFVALVGIPFHYYGPFPPSDPTGHAGPIRFYADTVAATTQGVSIPDGLAQAPWDFSSLGFYRGLVNEGSLLPSITTQPLAPVTPVALGSTVRLSVSANHADSFQWFKNGQPYPLTSPETASTLTLSSVSANEAGEYVVRAKNSSGLTFSDKAVLHVATIQVAGIVPASGSTQGGTHVTITGLGFEPGAYVAIGGVQASDVIVVSATTITAVTGAHAAGAANVFIANLDTHTDTLSEGFTYITPATGSLAVNLSPVGAVAAGAQWRVDGGSYHNSGESVNGLTPGSHTISFGAVTGYTTPADKSVTVASGGNTTDSGTYIVITAGTGPLTVNISPAGAVSAGAQWYVDGGGYHNGGETVTDLTSGSHNVSFKTVTGYTPPADQTVTINADVQTTANATYTASIGGVFLQQGPKLVGTGAVGNAYQGVSVSVSADGNTAIIGGSGDNGGAGAAWVWTRNGGIWTQQGPKLVGSGVVGNANQGISVSLSADGNTAIVGGPYDNSHVWNDGGGQSGTRYAGAAWVWTRSGGV